MRKFNLNEAQQHQREADELVWVKPEPCHICGKILKGAYGHTTLDCGTIWSCSKDCESKVQQLKGEENVSRSLQQPSGDS